MPAGDSNPRGYGTVQHRLQVPRDTQAEPGRPQTEPEQSAILPQAGSRTWKLSHGLSRGATGRCAPPGGGRPRRKMLRKPPHRASHPREKQGAPGEVAEGPPKMQ